MQVSNFVILKKYSSNLLDVEQIISNFIFILLLSAFNITIRILAFKPEYIVTLTELNRYRYCILLDVYHSQLHLWMYCNEKRFAKNLIKT